MRRLRSNTYPACLRFLHAAPSVRIIVVRRHTHHYKGGVREKQTGNRTGSAVLDPDWKLAVTAMSPHAKRSDEATSTRRIPGLLRMTRAKSFEVFNLRRTRGERRATLSAGGVRCQTGSTCTAARHFTYRVAGDQAGQTSDRWPRRLPSRRRAFEPARAMSIWFNGGRGGGRWIFDFINNTT